MEEHYLNVSILDRRSAAIAAVALLAVAMPALVACAATTSGAGGTSADPPAQEESQAAGDATNAEEQGPVPPVAREWAAAWNAGDAEQMAGLFAEDGIYEDHAFQVAFQGRDGVAQWVSITTESIDEPRVEIAETRRALTTRDAHTLFSR